MRELMDWNLCESNYIKKVEPDKEKIKSIRKMC